MNPILVCDTTEISLNPTIGSRVNLSVMDGVVNAPILNHSVQDGVSNFLAILAIVANVNVNRANNSVAIRVMLRHAGTVGRVTD